MERILKRKEIIFNVMLNNVVENPVCVLESIILMSIAILETRVSSDLRRFYLLSLTRRLKITWYMITRGINITRITMMTASRVSIHCQFQYDCCKR